MEVIHHGLEVIDRGLEVIHPRLEVIDFDHEGSVKTHEVSLQAHIQVGFSKIGAGCPIRGSRFSVDGRGVLLTQSALPFPPAITGRPKKHNITDSKVAAKRSTLMGYGPKKKYNYST